MNPTTPPAVPPTQPALTPPADRKSPIFLWIIIGLLVILGGLGTYGFVSLAQRNDALTNRIGILQKAQGQLSQEQEQLNKAIVALTEKEAEKPQVSGSNVEPMIPVGEMASQMLAFLKTTHSQTGEYPESLSVDGSKLLWRYNYNQMAAPAQNCPTDARYFSYSGYKNMATGKVDSFDMHYCDGATRVKKTEKDIR